MHATPLTANTNPNTNAMALNDELVPVATDPGPEVPPPLREPRPGEPPTPIIPEPVVPQPIIPDPLPPQPDPPQPAQAEAPGLAKSWTQSDGRGEACRHSFVDPEGSVVVYASSISADAGPSDQALRPAFDRQADVYRVRRDGRVTTSRQ